MKPAPTIATRGRSSNAGAERERVVEVAEHVHAVKFAAGPRPPSRARAGGQDQPVVLHLVAVGQHDPPPPPVQARGWHAEAPLGAEFVAWKVHAIDGVLAGQQLLG